MFLCFARIAVWYNSHTKNENNHQHTRHLEYVRFEAGNDV